MLPDMTPEERSLWERLRADRENKESSDILEQEDTIALRNCLKKYSEHYAKQRELDNIQKTKNNVMDGTQREHLLRRMDVGDYRSGEMWNHEQLMVKMQYLTGERRKFAEYLDSVYRGLEEEQIETENEMYTYQSLYDARNVKGPGKTEFNAIQNRAMTFNRWGGNLSDQRQRQFDTIWNLLSAVVEGKPDAIHQEACIEDFILRGQRGEEIKTTPIYMDDLGGLMQKYGDSASPYHRMDASALMGEMRRVIGKPELESAPEMFTFTAPDTSMIKVRKFADKVLEGSGELDALETAYGCDVFDKNLGAVLDKNQKKLLERSGKNVFDAIYIDGQSVNSLFGEKYGTLSPEEREKAMKCEVTAAVLAGGKSLAIARFKENEKNEVELQGVSAVKRDVQAKDPRPTFGQRFLAFFHIRPLRKTMQQNAQEMNAEENLQKSIAAAKEVGRVLKHGIERRRAGIEVQADHFQKVFGFPYEEFKGHLVKNSTNSIRQETENAVVSIRPETENAIVKFRTGFRNGLDPTNIASRGELGMLMLVYGQLLKDGTHRLADVVNENMLIEEKQQAAREVLDKMATPEGVAQIYVDVAKSLSGLKLAEEMGYALGADIHDPNALRTAFQEPANEPRLTALLTNLAVVGRGFAQAFLSPTGPNAPILGGEDIERGVQSLIKRSSTVGMESGDTVQGIREMYQAADAALEEADWIKFSQMTDVFDLYNKDLTVYADYAKGKKLEDYQKQQIADYKVRMNLTLEEALNHPEKPVGELSCGEALKQVSSIGTEPKISYKKISIEDVEDFLAGKTNVEEFSKKVLTDTVKAEIRAGTLETVEWRIRQRKFSPEGKRLFRQLNYPEGQEDQQDMETSYQQEREGSMQAAQEARRPEPVRETVSPGVSRAEPVKKAQGKSVGTVEEMDFASLMSGEKTKTRAHSRTLDAAKKAPQKSMQDVQKKGKSAARDI